MTLEEFQDQWLGLSPGDRLIAFRDWIDTELSSVLDLIPPIAIQLDSSAEPVSQIDDGFGVNPSLFQDDEPTGATAAGGLIVSRYFVIAQQKFYAQQKEFEELEKARQKFEDKLLDQLLKDIKIKGAVGDYASWYYGYYLPKYYGEYGSS